MRYVALAAAFVCVFPAHALAGEYKKCASIEPSGGSIAGEHFQCNQCSAELFRGEGCVKCGYVSLFVPREEKIVSTAHTAQGPFLDWLDNINVEASPQGKTVSTGAKSWNESGNNICLIVNTEER